MSFCETSAIRAADSAAYYVKQGLEFYKAEDYESALYAFETAKKHAPDDFRILYNQACTLLKSGQKKEAANQFRKTAFAKDESIAYESLMHLGNLAVEQALAISQRYEKNPTISVSTQKRILSELEIAEKEFSDAVFLLKNPQKMEKKTKEETKKLKAAKDNLEMVRLWRKQIFESWRKKDRQKERSFVDYLIEIEKKQEKLRREILAVSPTEESPKKLQILYLCSKEQTHIREDMINLQEKLHEKFLDDPDELRDLLHIGKEHLEEQIKKVRKMTEEFASYSNSASNHLLRYDSGSALQFQAAALEMIDSIRNQFRSYEQVVRAAEELQSKLCSEVEPRPLDEEGYDEIPAFRRELSGKTRFVLRWVLLFTEKAKLGVEMHSTLRPENFMTDIFNQSLQPNVHLDFKADSFSEIYETDEDLLLKSMKSAVQYGPKAEALLKTILRNLERNVDIELNEAQRKRIFSSMTQVKMILREILEPLNEKNDKEFDDPPEESSRNEKEDLENEQYPWNSSQNEENNQPDNLKDNAQNDGSSGKNNENQNLNQNQNQQPESDNSSGESSSQNRQEGKNINESTKKEEPAPNEKRAENDASASEKQNSQSSSRADQKGRELSEDPNSKTWLNDSGGTENFQSKETLNIKEMDDPQSAIIDSLNERDRVAFEKMSAGEKDLFLQQRKQGQERAENLIRSVKRRQREATKFRNQIRDLLQTSGDHDVKDW